MAEQGSSAYATAAYEFMSASMLSRQPLTTPDKIDKMGSAWSTFFLHLEARLGMLRNWRYSWWAHWARLAEYFKPERYHWLIVANRMSRGNPINDAIIDCTPTLALNICGSGLWTGMTSPSRPWFAFEAGLPWIKLDNEGKSWIEDTQKKAYQILSDSNFYQIMAQAFKDTALFGTAPVIVYEDYEDIIRLYLPCAGEYYLAVGGRLDVTDLYREFTFTVKEIVDMFQMKNCPEEIKQKFAQGGASLDLEYVVAHAIEPNFAVARQQGGDEEVAIVPGLFAYREIYWLKGIKTAQPLSKRGFHKKPFMVARWSTVSNDAYGRSPCMDALGDNRQIQLETRRKAEFIDKGVRPPMGANVELKNEPSSIISGMITYMSTEGGKKGFWPLFEPQAQWLAGITADIDKVSARIERCLFVDVFMAITRMEGVQPRNELELTKRDLERLQQLGPFITLFENEFGNPFFERLLDIMARRRILKPLPKSLRGVPLKIKYTSIMRLAQQSAEAVGLKDFFSTMGGLSSAAKAAGVPDPLRIVNLDASARHFAEVTNTPSNLLFTDAEVSQHDKIRQQAMQQAKQPGEMMAAVSAAKTLSDSSASSDNLLGQLLGSQGGGAGPA
jgi:Bacteriophage head to tail connecting protein